MKNVLVLTIRKGTIDMNIKSILDEEIQDEIETLKKMELGNDTYKTTVDGISKLIDKRIELEKVENDRKNEFETRETEYELKLAEIEHEKKDQRVKNGIAIGGIVLPLAVTVWGTVKSIKFEEEGTISTIMGRGFIQKLLPKLK